VVPGKVPAQGATASGMQPLLLVLIYMHTHSTIVVCALRVLDIAVACVHCVCLWQQFCMRSACVVCLYTA
jgi:hypothetical protein